MRRLGLTLSPRLCRELAMIDFAEIKLALSPLRWPHSHQLALVLAVATGTALTHHFYSWGEPLALWFGIFTVALRLPPEIEMG